MVVRVVRFEAFSIVLVLGPRPAGVPNFVKIPENKLLVG